MLQPRRDAKVALPLYEVRCGLDILTLALTHGQHANILLGVNAGGSLSCSRSGTCQACFQLGLLHCDVCRSASNIFQQVLLQKNVACFAAMHVPVTLHIGH
jgi:hypothetical protein